MTAVPRGQDASAQKDAFSRLCNTYSVGLFFLIAICQAFVWGTLQKWNDGVDPLAIPWINGHLVSIDGWSIIHVVCFVGCGIICPDRMLLFMFFGFLWEVYESVLAGGHSFWSERGVNSAWDIWFNLAGYRLGEYLLVSMGESEVVRAAKAMFFFGICSTVIVAAISVARGELQVGLLDLVVVVGVATFTHRSFST